MGVYFNDNGDLKLIAGEGKAEYGASTIRKGTETLQVTSGTGVSKLITFSSPMPDTNYVINIEETAIMGNQTLLIANKTINGFTAHAWFNREGNDQYVTFNYTAFKLYTDIDNSKALANTEYSTTETAIGTWYDGKTIYRKVLTGTTGPTGNETYPYNTNSISVPINETCDTVINISGIIKNQSGITTMVNVPTASTQWVVAWGRGNAHPTNPNTIGLATGTGATSLPFVLVVEYTKSN